ncbi:DUF5366 family protein [Neobacillus terrae]|uniref:DUF5366 family protein n=1 Tax=Neobacillus terrae TaxID=3034837 RepID=UPI00140CF3CF|nr:DUF5366 family protein [Neobacillus terrae]NHM32814.1 YufK family protein [Neobacillus terrae]
MKNTYLTSYFPLLSIILFSLSFAIAIEIPLLSFLQKTGIYTGMLEFFSDSGVKLSIMALLTVMFFMVFAALKLVADTINELALLFFSQDSDGESLRKVRNGPLFFAGGAALSLLSIQHLTVLAGVFLATSFVYFVFFVFKVSPALKTSGLIGIIFFQILTWSILILGVAFLAVKVYNSIVASLPV